MEHAYVNGKIVRADKAVISIFDRGLVLGDGLFETLRAVDYIPEFYRAHYQRLKKSSSKLKIQLRASLEELAEIIFEVCKKSKIKDGAVRITLTRGQYTGGLAIDPEIPPSLMVSVRKVPNEGVLGNAGVRVAVSSVNKEAASGLDPTLKSTNYLANIFAKAEADKKKCYEAILLGKKGEIAELSTASFFAVKGNKVFTPPIDTGILPGITRQAILSVMKSKKIDFAEKPLFLKDLKSFSETFLTSSVRGVVPITKIEDTTIGSGVPGSLTRDLSRLYIKESSKSRERFKVQFGLG